MSPTEQLNLICKLRSTALSALESMYLPPKGLFVFTKKKRPGGISYEGISHRYTSIALLGLAGEDRQIAAQILDGQTPAEVCRRMTDAIQTATSLGDIALTLWASHVLGVPDRRVIYALQARQPLADGHPTVEVAWALKALCVAQTADVGDLRERLAERLVTSFNRTAGVFPHVLGNPSSFRSHVACFADQVYPIQALAAYHARSKDLQALELASRCAATICDLQGDGGQWWWHYHRDTGRIIEGYPVYSVHQYGMAPMALFELHAAGGPDYSKAVYRGLEWMRRAPEINASLIDRDQGAIWRKVDRTGPRKFCRRVKAAASRIHASLRLDLLNGLFPPLAIDYECRPYCMGWLLYAWPGTRISRMNA
jgi:hypothetical protein